MNNNHYKLLVLKYREEYTLTKTVAMPADTNTNGDIFGGWLLSQMDVAGGILAGKVARVGLLL